MPKIFFATQFSRFSTVTGETSYTDSLWASDGTPAGTYPVLPNLDFATTADDGISQITAFGRRVAFFTSFSNGVRGDLWVSDGTAAGTVPIRPVDAGGAARNLAVDGLTGFNGALLFGAESSSLQGYGLWRSDGTPGGTVLLKTIFGATGFKALRDFTVVNGQLYFIADFEGSNGFGGTNGVYNGELWRSDGTAAGTVRVQGLSVSTLYRPSLEAVGGTLFYGVNTELAATDAELWKIGADGVPVLVRDITTSTNTARLSELTAVGSTLFFTTSDGVTGTELWKSDGTAAGTVLVRDLVPGTGSSDPRDLEAAGGVLLFTATSASTGRELWRSDGTAGGTYLVKDIVPGPTGSSPTALVGLNGAAVLSVGTNLWRSDGTDAGTYQIEPGLQAVRDVEAFRGRLYFEASYGGNATGLFSTAGLPGTTVGIAGGGPQGGVDLNAGFAIPDVPRPARSDLNGDGTSDIVLQGGGTVVDWLMGGGLYQGGNVVATGADGYAVRGKGDFNGDTQADIVLQNGGTVVAWTMGGGIYRGGSVLSTAAAGYDVVGTGDFNGDGTDDILLQSGGTVVAWLMQGGAYAAGSVITTGAAGYAVKAVGDLNGDGTDDVVLQSGGVVVDWIMQGGAYQRGNVLTTDAAGYEVKGAGDVNGDGTDDIVLQAGGTVVDWIMQGGAYAAGNVITTGAAGFDVRAVADVNGDRTSDIVLQGGGTVVDWIMAGGTYQSGNVITTEATGFTVV